MTSSLFSLSVWIVVLCEVLIISDPPFCFVLGLGFFICWFGFGVVLGFVCFLGVCMCVCVCFGFVLFVFPLSQMLDS